MIKALKGTPQEDNRVLSDPYNWRSLYPRLHLSAPISRCELRAAVLHSYPFAATATATDSATLKTCKLKGVS